jgi:hypothetical protein
MHAHLELMKKERIFHRIVCHFLEEGSMWQLPHAGCKACHLLQTGQEG